MKLTKSQLKEMIREELLNERKIYKGIGLNSKKEFIKAMTGIIKDMVSGKQHSEIYHSDTGEVFVNNEGGSRGKLIIELDTVQELK